MLRASSKVEAGAAEVDLNALVDSRIIDSGVTAGRDLIEFAEAALGDDTASIREARQRLSESLGETAMVDAAGIIANFQRMVRIADGTGIPLDAPMAAITSDLRFELGINHYGSAGNTPAPSLFARLLARVAKPFLPGLLKRGKQAGG